jgi:N-acetylglucosamine kinase-like BadF-type ATPase
MSKHFLGIDGGGTKTHACLADINGHILSVATNGGANWERIGVPQVEVALIEVINGALAKAHLDISNISTATFALAGMDWAADSEIFAPFATTSGLGPAAVFVNDAIAALHAGIPSGIGIASIAGTGGKTVGFDGTTLVRTMGMSMGESGGAGLLMSLATERMAFAEHGQKSATLLSQALPESYGITGIRTFFKAIARENLLLDEDRSPLIFDLAKNGDSGAKEVVEAVAIQHARDVLGIANQLAFSDSHFPVIRAGGLHTAGSSIFDEAFITTLHAQLPNAIAHVLTIAPVIGATIHAAARELGTIPAAFLQNILSDAKQLPQF